jgi:hypothetical protein
MTTHTLAQTLTNVRQIIGRYAWWLGLSLVLGLAAVGAYHTTPVPTVSAPMVRGTQAVPLDPALQSVMDYLRAHSSDQPLHVSAVLHDPATQSALDYIRAHSGDRAQRAATPWNQATQAVLDYLRVHSR